MGVWRDRVNTPTKLENFRREFSIPDDVHLRLAEEEKDSIMPTENSMPFPVVAFVQCGLRFPLDPLFRQVLHYYTLNPMQITINALRTLLGIIALARQEGVRITLSDIQYCYTMTALNLGEKGYVYYLKPRSTEYKIIADLPDSNKGAGEDYLIASGNWEFGPDEEAQLFPLPRTIKEGKDVRQPPKGFRQSYTVREGLKKLLDLPLEQRKAPLLLNFVPTYTSKLSDVPRKRKKSASQSTAPTEQAASSSEPAEQPSSSAPPVTEKKRRRRLVKKTDMERPKKTVRDLLANLPDDGDDAPTQTVPPPKPQRVKRAQSKTKATKAPAEVDDTVPISQLAQKTISAPAKRSAGTQPSGSAPSKKQKTTSGTTPRSKIPKIPWEPKITLEDRPVYANESAEDINVGVALSTAVLLEGDLEQNAQLSEFENYCLMMQRSVQAMQHAHSFSVQAFHTRSELVDLKREFAHIHKQNRAQQIKMKELEDQAAAAIKAKQLADEKAEAAEAVKNVAVSQQKEAEARVAQAEKELQEALATKEADIKAADAQAYQQGMDAVEEDYKLQVLKACNRGFVLGWNALSKQLNLPADSPWRKTKAMRLPCPLPPSPTQTEEETESEAEAEVEVEAEVEALVRKAKSPSNTEQIMDLTGDEDLEAAPKEADIGTLSSDLLLAVRSVDETVAEIDAEVAADKAAEVVAEKLTEVEADKEADAVVENDPEVIPPEPSDVPAQSSVQVEEV